MVQVDMSGAIKKTAAMLKLPQAAKMQVTDWASKMVLDLQLSAKAQRKSWEKGRAVGQMSRNIGFVISPTAESGWTVLIGTGVHGRMTVVYADIQDRGGTTHPTVTPRMRRWAWAMMYKTKDEKYRAIALTKKDKLTVKIPGSSWFTTPIKQRTPELQRMMTPEWIYKRAEQMANLGGGE